MKQTHFLTSGTAADSIAADLAGILLYSRRGTYRRRPAALNDVWMDAEEQ